MGALKIDCYCNEKQMEKIVDMVAVHLDESDRTEVADFDDVVDDVRVCVAFDTYLDEVSLKVADVLDKDWDQLHEDSAVLTSRLKPIVKEYNRNHKETSYQAHHVLQDRWR